MIKRLSLRPENFFLYARHDDSEVPKIEEWMKRYTFLGTPVYFLSFFCGQNVI